MYSVPLISLDLSPVETVTQMISALTQLDHISRAIFDRIDQRVDAQIDQLNRLDQRIDGVQKQVQGIRGSKKATAIFAHARYPSVPSQPLAALMVDLPPVTLPKMSIPDEFLPPRPLRGLEPREIKGKLRSYHVKGQKRLTSSYDQLREGRALPEDIGSASSFLVFNTADNPYLSGMHVNPLSIRHKSRKPGEDHQDQSGLKDLDEAPVSLRPGHELDMSDQDQHFYNPDMGDLPEFDLPDNLDLSNIAQDLTYANDPGAGILPSITLPELPTLTSSVEMRPKPPNTLPPSPPLPPSTAPMPILPIVTTGDTNPPPPPPPPPPTMTTSPPPPPPMTAPPPPPPPPPSGPPSSIDPSMSSEDAPDGPQPKISVGADGRANLMEAIRQAGGKSGASLRSIQERKREEKLAKQEEKERGVGGSRSGGAGGDLLADLAAKLSMRRKGIAGSGGGQPSKSTTTVNEGAGGSVLSKISSMIPDPNDDLDDSESNNDSASDDWD
ncbi:hypothetical protein TCAL_08153 [Tigriopus californicus]|uniref:WH2 domain-containing protein n=1 Tax=Tigriopus californicus TaxID=6832 RepID=A0A553P2Q1_TIGCA|nr:WASH complex subunit 1-like [Tigriopus californicus]TRY71959.1 hypothetical protein TCAL_08153 [Tigriopus californicus]|eukprot:TCALIF_08153-PA protein Name:"Similar to WASH1 WAS protein family homolog 1 (Gallus gallus)" AED:0.01 eAED:0.02 QI:0/-1/0/1/-1/1/1/0/496